MTVTMAVASDAATCPACRLPGNAPADPRQAVCPRCRRARTWDIDGLREQADAVQAALLRRGMTLRARTVVKLRTGAALARSGIFTSPDQIGVTSIHAAPGRRPATITIALAAGLGSTWTRAVLAHEYGHALLFDRATYDLPAQLAEGFAEFLAHTYLTRDDRTPEAITIAHAMLANPDPVYGRGLRLIHAHVTEHGFPHVWRALRSGNPDSHQGLLTSPGTPTIRSTA